MLVQLRTSLLHRLLRFHGAISVHFELDSLLQGVGLLVSSEPHMGVPQQLIPHWVSERVVLLVDHEGGRVLLSLIVDALHQVSGGQA